MPTPQTNEEIIAAFDEKFILNKREDGEDFTLYLRDSAIKQFLTHSLEKVKLAERARILEEVNKMKGGYCSGMNDAEADANGNSGYDSAITDILSLINKV